VENSWGTYWGNKGFGKLSWAVVAKDVIMADVAY
ncbi:peptidase C1, partial [Xanthomonas oryzae pv. oryzae]